MAGTKVNFAALIKIIEQAEEYSGTITITSNHY
jgi:hypothetical protein